jgi:hypothetical protein
MSRRSGFQSFAGGRGGGSVGTQFVMIFQIDFITAAERRRFELHSIIGIWGYKTPVRHLPDAVHISSILWILKE